MHRLILTSTVALAATAAAVPNAVASPVTGDITAKRLAHVRVAECSWGPEAIDRHATFRGVMRRVPQTARMWMRFSLQERVGGGRYRTIKAPGLGGWRKSHPAVRRFSYRQRVLELAAGSVYRAVVSFRWYNAGGEVIRKARRRSRPCGQPGPLANVAVLRIGGGLPLAGAPLLSTYDVAVVNGGRLASPPFGVSLAVDGAVVNTQSVGALLPGEARRLYFTGPLCVGSLTARADSEDAIREVSERDNVLTASCPAPA